MISILNNSGDNNRLKIYTLGKFKVIRGDEVLSEKAGSYYKVWKLFKYLITNKESIFNGEVIMETLWPDQELTDPKHAFRNLIYRLRKILKSGKEEKIIKFYSQTYYFDFDSNCYWFDAEQFELLCEKAYKEINNNRYEALSLYETALSLYKGDYLSELTYDEWTFLPRDYYHRIYLRSVLEVLILLKEDKKYELIRDICEKAFKFELFEEDIHYAYLDALIELNKREKARIHYNYFTSIFDQELGIEPSYKMKILLDRIVPINKSFDLKLNDILVELTDTHLERKTAFLCDSQTFRKVYRLEQRKLDRLKYPIIFCSINLTPKNYDQILDNELEDSMNCLQTILLEKLRWGDVVSRWSKNQILLLLPNLVSQDIGKVLARIKKEFYARQKSNNFLIQYQHRLL